MEANVKWNMVQALELIRKVQPEARKAGYALNLGGGVLNKGYSCHDLDIVALPGSFDTQDLALLLKVFEEYGYSIKEHSTKYPGIDLFKLMGSVDVVIPKLNKLSYQSFADVAQAASNRAFTENFSGE